MKHGRRKRLAIIVSTAAKDFPLAFELAHKGCLLGHEVGIFFMSNAVQHLPIHRSELHELVEAGCELMACGSSASQAGISEKHLGITLGSQDDHAALVHKSDRVLAFT